MRPMDLAKKLRREAAFDPAALERGKVALMAAMRQEVEPRREPTIVPELPYQDIGAALTFLERAFGFREIPAWRLVTADGVLHRAIVEFGDGVIAIGEHGAHGALSPYGNAKFRTGSSVISPRKSSLRSRSAAYPQPSSRGFRWLNVWCAISWPRFASSR